MNKLFYDLVEKNIDFSSEKEKMEIMSQKDINLFIEDIFWRYDANKLSFNIPSINKENNQKIIDLVVKQPYYLECILEDIQCFPSKMIYCDKGISLVKNLKVTKKENFIEIIKKFICIHFFVLNYSQFNYNDEEKDIIKNLFNEYYFDYKEDPKLSINDKKEIFNKTGLIEPFLMSTMMTRNIENEEFDFFINHYKYSPNYQIVRHVFLTKNFYDLARFNEDSYCLFLFKNSYYINNIIEKLENDINDSVNKKIKDALIHILRLTEKMMLNNKLENF